MDFASVLYDSEIFAQVCQVLNNESIRYLKEARAAELPTTDHQTPRDMLTAIENLMKAEPLALNEKSASEIPKRVQALVRAFLESSTCLQSPNYMGHQVNPPVPIASAMTAIGGLLNPGLAVYEMSQFASAIERALIAKLGPFLNWPAGTYDGVVTSGGSLANLTAILAARNWKYPDAWKAGLQGRKGAILTSADSHYCVMRAAGALGLGTDQIIKIPLDEKRRMDARKLPEMYAHAITRGLEPFCVVGSACSTPIGAFDPLDEIAEFAEANGLWFHVDAAHGGPFLLSQKHRHLLGGIERADSVVWDAHKMMFVPSLCTFVLYRNRANSYLPFRQEAPYLFNSPEAAISSAAVHDDPRSYDGGLRTFECTKGPIALPLWTLWTVFGETVFSQLNERMIENTLLFHKLVGMSEDFVSAHDPQCNILCFRYQPPHLSLQSAAEVSALQMKVRSAIVHDGEFYITGTAIDGVYALRVTLMNPFTSEDHILKLLEKIRTLAKDAG